MQFQTGKMFYSILGVFAAWEGDKNGHRIGKIAKFGRNMVNNSASINRTKLKRYSGEAHRRVLSECQLKIIIFNGGGGKKA